MDLDFQDFPRNAIRETGIRIFDFRKIGLQNFGDEIIAVISIRRLRGTLAFLDQSEGYTKYVTKI